MWHTMHYFPNIVGDFGEEIYENLQSEDHSEVIMKLYKNVIKNPFKINLENKCESKSNACRKQGNDAFNSQCYRQALIFYNMALCYAPKNSRSLVLAYSNRSALLYKLQEFKDSLKDIEMCYKLECPSDLVQKLKAREQRCHELKTNNEILEQIQRRLLSSADFLKLGSTYSKDILCTSKAVKVDTSGPQPIFVAAEDIDVGTVVALEEAFMTTLDEKDEYLACYHCMKASLNLIPCNDCCLVMFCDDSCKRTAFEEYHDIECKLLYKQYIGNGNLALKAIIKIKRSCSNWMEFIEASNKVCMSQIEKGEYNTLITHANPFSILYNTTNTFILIGKKITCAILTAILIMNLENLGSFFPPTQNIKLLAMRATAKVLMHLFLYTKGIILSQAIKNSHSAEVFETLSTGFYTFLDKLEHSCHPNLIVTAMNNKALVTALQPIPCGTALTMSYVGHYFHTETPNGAIFLYHMIGATCSCYLCTGKRDEIPETNCKLSLAQQKYFKKFDLDTIFHDISLIHNPNSLYQKICLGLKLFMDLPYSMEYKQLFMAFFRLQGDLRVCKTGAKSIYM